ncbi:MAG: primosomal protein N', partial [Desulfovibrio sp.]|nr:primosomal protein N' [Desulfovibrio sp.]
MLLWWSGSCVSSLMYVTLALLSVPFSALTYAAHAEFPESIWKPGLRCLVPMGRGKDKICTALVLATSAHHGLPERVKIKSILWPLETIPLLGQELFLLFTDLAKRQCETVGHVASQVLPFFLRNPDVLLHTVENNAPCFYTPIELMSLSAEKTAKLAAQFLCGNAKFERNKTRAEESYVLNCDPPWPVRPGAKAQIKILEYLANNGRTSKKQLYHALGGNLKTALDKLLSLRAVVLGLSSDEIKNEEQLLPPPSRPFTLNEEQRVAVEALCEHLHRKCFYSALLYGVTGSGKTAVYLHLAVETLKMGRSVLLLVPEVAITLKLMQDAHILYPEIPVLCYHGYLSPRSREKIWHTVAAEKAVFIIGTRSALFLPLCNLGCLILDEEHDASFKQDEGFTYHAKELAWFRANYNQALFLLGSATPDCRTYYAVQTGTMPIQKLVHRISGQALPPITLISTRESDCLSKEVPLLAKKSLDLLSATVERGEQAVILVNRRGFASNLYCVECGKTEHCPGCEIGLTYHKERGQLLCHYCGYTRAFPAPCSVCGGSTFLPMGAGTEMVTEELSAYFGRPILRLDRDVTARVGQMERILMAFAEQESPILVGTQMLSKG